MDVTDDGSVVAGVDGVIRDHGGIDGVVTCAGWGLAGPVEQTPLADARLQMETNFFGTVRVVTAALPSLRQRSGRVVLMSSIGGVIGLPFQAYYSASKFALEGWAEALAWEVRPFGVGVTLVEPGNFRTGFTAGRRTVEVADDDPYASASTRAIGKMADDELGGADPMDVARVVAKVLTAGPTTPSPVGRTGRRAGRGDGQAPAAQPVVRCGQRLEPRRLACPDDRSRRARIAHGPERRHRSDHRVTDLSPVAIRPSPRGL